MPRRPPIENRAPEDRPRAGTTKLTPKNEAKLVRAIGLGVPVKIAALSIGVDQETIGLWIKRFPDFLAKIEAVRASSAITAHERIEKAAKDGNLQATKFQLERLFPDEYSKRSVQINIPQPPASDDDEETTLPSASSFTLNLNLPWNSGRRLRNDPDALDALDQLLDGNAEVPGPSADTNRQAPSTKQPSGNGSDVQRRPVASSASPQVSQPKDRRLHPRTKPAPSGANTNPARKKRAP